MTEQSAQTNIEEATIEVVVIRADGTRENHGTVAYWHRNPLKRLFWRIKRWRH